MEKLQLMTEWELEQIFGPVDKLIPIHEGIKKKTTPKSWRELTTKNYGIK